MDIGYEMIWLYEIDCLAYIIFKILKFTFFRVHLHIGRKVHITLRYMQRHCCGTPTINT